MRFFNTNIVNHLYTANYNINSIFTASLIHIKILGNNQQLSSCPKCWSYV